MYCFLTKNAIEHTIGKGIREIEEKKWNKRDGERRNDNKVDICYGKGEEKEKHIKNLKKIVVWKAKSYYNGISEIKNIWAH